MSEYLIQDTTLTNIANAVRNKTGESRQLSPAQISSKITNELVKPSGNKAITATTATQTGIDVTNYATVSVAPTPSETKTVTTNGDVTPSSGKLLSKVTVAIPSYTNLS